jgi:uncharacterized protein (DUF2267 family)
LKWLSARPNRKQGVDYTRFITIVARMAGVGHEDAENAARATLQTLAERISQGEARQLAEQLPPELAPWVPAAGKGEPFDMDEFLRRIAEREGVELETARRHARAVLAAVARAVGHDQFDDVVAQLPKDYAALLPRGPYVEVTPADTFLQRVAERAGVDADAARRAIDAVLETLAERISGGEVDDLISRLPVQLHEPLKRGRASSGEPATPMSLDEFLQRVAEREGVTPDEAREHARAVFLTLREAVGDGELFDVTSQLPDEYVRELAPLKVRG